MSDPGDIILPFPAPLPRIEVVSAVRSTLIASSLQSLRARGLLSRYTQLLPAELHETVLHCIAGEWFPLEVGFAHYRACDALELTPDLQREIGNDVSRRIQETFLATVLQMAKGVGVTPWSLMPKGNQIFARVFRGGGTQVTKLGPKDVSIEIARLPLLEINYFRTALQAIYQTAIGMFAKRAHVRIVTGSSRTPGSLTTLHASWV